MSPLPDIDKPAYARSCHQGHRPAAALHQNDLPLYVCASGVYTGGQFGAGEALGAWCLPSTVTISGRTASVPPTVRAAYVSGAMAGGIGSAEIVIAMGEAGLLGFYGAGGLPLPVVEKDVARIKDALGTDQRASTCSTTLSSPRSRWEPSRCSSSTVVEPSPRVRS